MRCATLRAISIFAILLPFSAQTASAERSTVPNMLADESASAAMITVIPGCGPLLPLLGIRSIYSTEDGSAKAGEDYEAVSGHFPLFEGGARRRFRIPLIEATLTVIDDETARRSARKGS